MTWAEMALEPASCLSSIVKTPKQQTQLVHWTRGRHGIRSVVSDSAGRICNLDIGQNERHGMKEVVRGEGKTLRGGR